MQGAIGAALPSVATCRGCHPDADMHPTEVKPDKIGVPDGWPLEQGLLVCSTCHAEPSCDAARPTEAPWLRGGVPSPRLDFCYRCHKPEDYRREDPHHPETPRGKKDSSCSVCHDAQPETGARLADSALRFDDARICGECHLEQPHSGVAAHMGEVVSDRARRSLPDAIALTDEGEIACWTCHEMHDPAPAGPLAGDLPRRTAIALVEEALEHDWDGKIAEGTRWPGAPREGHDALLALPLNDDALCVACHGKEP